MLRRQRGRAGDCVAGQGARTFLRRSRVLLRGGRRRGVVLEPESGLGWRTGQRVLRRGGGLRLRDQRSAVQEEGSRGRMVCDMLRSWAEFHLEWGRAGGRRERRWRERRCRPDCAWELAPARSGQAAPVYPIATRTCAGSIEGGVGRCLGRLMRGPEETSPVQAGWGDRVTWAWRHGERSSPGSVRSGRSIEVPFLVDTPVQRNRTRERYSQATWSSRSVWLAAQPRKPSIGEDASKHWSRPASKPNKVPSTQT